MNIRFLQALQGPFPFQSFPTAVARTGPRTRLIASAVALLLVVAVVWYLVASSGSTKARVVPPVTVAVEVAKRQNVQIVEHTIGTILAESTVQLTAQVTGQLLAANFTEGQIVHKGDLLFQIDPRPYKAALDSAGA